MVGFKFKHNFEKYLVCFCDQQCTSKKEGF